jgi:hypothetical protein
MNYSIGILLILLYLQKQSLHDIYGKFNSKLGYVVITFTNENVKTRSDSQNLCLPVVTERSSLQGKVARAQLLKLRIHGESLQILAYTYDELTLN